MIMGHKAYVNRQAMIEAGIVSLLLEWAREVIDLVIKPVLRVVILCFNFQLGFYSIQLLLCCGHT